LGPNDRAVSARSECGTAVKVSLVTDEGKIREMVRRVVYRTVGRSDTGRSPGSRLLVTEHEIHRVPVGGEFALPDGALVTPLARQAAMERKIRLRENGRTGAEIAGGREEAGGSERKVAIGADHGGFELKEQLESYLEELGFQVIDCGTHTDESVDYPDFAFAVAGLVAGGRAWRGIVVEDAVVETLMGGSEKEAIQKALEKFDKRFIVGDEKTTKERDMIEPMVQIAVKELMEFGKPEFPEEGGQSKRSKQ